jgi:hypothetical protein
MDGRHLGIIQQESTFWTKKLYIKSGGVDPDYKYAGDYHLWKKFATYEKLYVVNSVLAGFRRHAGQKSEDRSLYYGEIGRLNNLEKIMAKIKVYSIRRLIVNRFMGENLIKINEII